MTEHLVNFDFLGSHAPDIRAVFPLLFFLALLFPPLLFFILVAALAIFIPFIRSGFPVLAPVQSRPIHPRSLRSPPLPV